MKSEQNLNAVKQNFEIQSAFKGSDCRRVMVAVMDMLTRLSKVVHVPFILFSLAELQF